MSRKLQVSLDSIEKVKNFVNTITKYETDVDLMSGRYVIDAKSIMGIFSLDLSKPIDLKIHKTEEAEDMLAELEPFLIESNEKKDSKYI